MEEIKQQLSNLEKLVDGLAVLTMKGFEEARKERQKLRVDFKKDITATRDEILRDMATLKLELLEKLAPKDRVDNHELRIQTLETHASSKAS